MEGSWRKWWHTEGCYKPDHSFTSLASVPSVPFPSSTRICVWPEPTLPCYQASGVWSVCRIFRLDSWSIMLFKVQCVPALYGVELGSICCLHQCEQPDLMLIFPAGQLWWHMEGFCFTEGTPQGAPAPWVSSKQEGSSPGTGVSTWALH